MSIPPRSRAIAAMPSRALFGLAIAGLLVATLLVGAKPATAAQKCWSKVVQDWYDDGVIQGNYERRCYTQALKNVGEDVRVYSSFQEDIKAALQRQGRNVRTPQSVGPSRTPAATDTRRDAGGGNPEPRQELFKQAFDKLGPREADSMPIPLLILGGLALLLIAAGATGLISRRVRARRAQAP